jgi:hypothetical protein
VKTEGRGHVVDEWKLRPEAVDIHGIDGVVGCAGSILGVILPGTDARPNANVRRARQSELQRGRSS